MEPSCDASFSVQAQASFAVSICDVKSRFTVFDTGGSDLPPLIGFMFVYPAGS